MATLAEKYITQKFLKENYSYSKTTGILQHKITGTRGHMDKDGYLLINVKVENRSICVRLHRLILVLCYRRMAKYY